MKKLKIEPKGVAYRYNAENGERGECSELLNMRERNSALETVGEWNTLGYLKGGARLMLIDRRKEGDFFISCVGNDVYLSGRRVESHFIEENTLINKYDGEIQWLQSVGDFVVVSTTHGCRYLRYVSGRYVQLDIADMMPQLKFRATNTTKVSVAIEGAEFATDYAEWERISDKDLKQLRVKVETGMALLNDRAKQSGAYLQPVSVRYAVKLWDGSYSWISAPVIVGNGVQLASKISAQVDNSISAYYDSELSGSIYNIGAVVVKLPSQDWLPLIKSVDILVSEEMSPFMNGDLNCRCETSGATRYMTFGLREKERVVSSAELVNPAKWRVLTSITEIENLSVGETMTILRSELFSETVARDTILRLVKNINHDVISNAGLSLRGKLYMGGNVHRIRNMWSSVQYWGEEVIGQSCKVIVAARLRTENGVAVQVNNEEYDYTPNNLNALISYPDSRAEELTIKLLSGDRIMEWTGKLSGCDEQGYAYFHNENIVETELFAGYSFYPPTEQNVDEWNGSEVVVSVKENPFVTEQRRSVGQGEVKSLASVLQPIYSSVFGRYPVYAFTTEGIYAMSYKERGDYNDVQLLDRRLLDEGGAVTLSNDKVYFVAQAGELCCISGKNVKELITVNDVIQTVWVKKQKELLLLHEDGSITVMMESGRIYKRSQKKLALYGNFYSAYAIDDNGVISDLNDERKAMLPVLLETYPIAPADSDLVAPVLYGLNATGEFSLSGLLELIGSDGVGSTQSSVSSIALFGYYSQPIAKRIYVRPCRMLTIKLSGESISGTLIRDFAVQYC